MRLIVELDDEFYNHIQNDHKYFLEDGEELYSIVQNTTPISDNGAEESIEIVKQIKNKLKELKAYDSFEYFVSELLKEICSEDKKDCTTCIGFRDKDYEQSFCHDCIKGIQNHYKENADETCY